MNERERINQIESTLIGARMPLKTPDQPTVASLVEQLREHIRQMNKVCDDIDQAVAASEQAARDAGDSLINVIKRIK